MLGPEDANATPAWLAVQANRARIRACAMSVTVGTFMDGSIGIDDLCQAGAIAFAEAWPRGREYPVTYAMRRAEGAMRDLIRHERKLRFVDGEPWQGPSLRLTRRLRRTVRSLRRPYREVMLPLLDGASTEEIAEKLGIRLRLVHLRKFRAIRMLREKCGVSEDGVSAAWRHSPTGSASPCSVHTFERRTFLDTYKPLDTWQPLEQG